jgi:hypothetical protein
MLDLERAVDEFDNFTTNLCADLQESWQLIKTALAESSLPNRWLQYAICRTSFSPEAID